MSDIRTDRGRRTRRGNALVPALLMVVSALAVTVAAFSVGLRRANEVVADVDDRRAEHLAEAGIREATLSMALDGSGNIGSLAEPAYLGGGVLWVEATPLGDGTTRLVATALAGSGRAALEAIVEDKAGKEPLFQSTLNSKETLTMNNAVVTDSYESALGTYASQAVNVTNGYTHAKMGGTVKSNQDVILNADAQVFGDATPGPTYGVTFNNNSYASGSIAPAPESALFPDVEVPTWASTGNFDVPPSGALTLAPGDHSFGTLSIQKGGTLTLTGPATIVVDDFTTFKDSNLLVDATAGPVTVHVKNTYTHANGFEANAVAGSPMALAFYIQGTTDLTFPGGSMVRGGYYVPNANVLFTSSNELWGACSAKRVEMASSMRFHYDESLQDYFEEDSSSGFEPVKVLALGPAPITPSFLAADRSDPIQLLALDVGVLPSPADAAWDPIEAPQ